MRAQKRLEWLLSAPCDSPWLPADLAVRLADAARAQACRSRPRPRPTLRPKLAAARFRAVHVSLADDLAAALDAGERKVRAWYARHKAAEVAFADERAFYNINSFQELADLDRA
jgi:molybdopterin-guanine dinucleotide biosynthesis protein A